MISLVTGGAGFIGSNLVDELVKLKHKVIVLDNLKTGRISNLEKSKKKIIFKKLDLYKDKSKINKIFKNYKVDNVFHLAGLADIVPSIVKPQDYFDTNVVGTLNILEAAKNFKVKKFIYAASASCYGIPKKYPTNETSPVTTEYPYATSKYLGEKLVLDWAKIYKMNNVSFRFFNVYGPRSRTTGAYGAVFGVFLAQKLANKPLTIVGNGKQTRDFIHVFDVTSALCKSIKNAKSGEIYNLGSGKQTTVNQIANLISNKKLFIPERPGEPKRSQADIKKIKNHLNWYPKINIFDGVKDLLSNLDNYKHAPVWTKNKIKLATKVWFHYLKKK